MFKVIFPTMVIMGGVLYPAGKPVMVDDPKKYARLGAKVISEEPDPVSDELALEDEKPAPEKPKRAPRKKKSEA